MAFPILIPRLLPGNDTALSYHLEQASARVFDKLPRSHPLSILQRSPDGRADRGAKIATQEVFIAAQVGNLQWHGIFAFAFVDGKLNQEMRILRLFVVFAIVMCGTKDITFCVTWRYAVAKSSITILYV